MSHSPQSPSKVAPVSSSVGGGADRKSRPQNSIGFRPDDDAYDSGLWGHTSGVDRGMEKNRGPVQDERTSPSRKSERAHQARQLGRQVGVHQGDQGRGSFDSGKGFVDERGESPPLGFDRNSDESSNSGRSSLWDEMGSNHSANRSTKMECSPLKLNGRKCAKAMVGCAALAVLGVTVTHLLAEDYQAFGLVYRKPPQGRGNGRGAAPIHWLPREDQNKDSGEETASPQEKHRWSKEDRMQDHEERVRFQVAECKRRNYEAVDCRSMLQEASNDDPYYYNVSAEDRRTAPQEGQYGRLLRGAGLDLDGDEESYNFQYRRYLQGIDNEYRGDKESSRGFRMVQALVEELEQELERQRSGLRRSS